MLTNVFDLLRQIEFTHLGFSLSRFLVTQQNIEVRV